MVEDSKSYEQLDYESKLERLRRDQQTQEYWDSLGRPDTVRIPSEDPLGPRDDKPATWLQSTPAGLRSA